MITRFGILSLVALAVSLTQAAEPREAEGKTPQAKADIEAVAQAGNAFACELYAKLRGLDGNLFLSPASIHTALSMTYAGAAGQTAAQMADVLHLRLPVDRLHEAFGRLAHELNHPPRVQERVAYDLVVSNALWPQAGFAIKDSFTSLVQTHYGAGLHPLDYSKPERARETINGWVEKNTREKIKDLIPPHALGRDTCLVLTNAIYFKSDWGSPFSEHATHEGDFHLPDGTAVKAPLMHQQLHTQYMETDQFQLVDLPYKGGVLSMTILLPRQIKGLTALEKKLAAKELATWISQAERTHIDLTLPRFTFTSGFKLKKPLVQLGMADAFGGGADFSGMTHGGTISITEVLHKAFVAVDERGTEAAGATAVIMSRTAVPLKPEVVFRADRPFLFLIQHRPTGAILFLGRVVNPKG